MEWGPGVPYFKTNHDKLTNQLSHGMTNVSDKNHPHKHITLRSVWLVTTNTYVYIINNYTYMYTHTYMHQPCKKGNTSF